MSILLYRSNRLEHLADALASVLDHPVDGPLAPDRLVVQSPGMYEWVASALAARRSIAANLAWWRPRQMVEAVLRIALDDKRLRLDAWDRERLTWVLMRMLPKVVDEPGFEVLQHWLNATETGATERRFQLARRIAHVFDQYTVYRPQMVMEWQSGKDDEWQAQLWRRLARELEGGHLAQLTQQFFRKIDGPRPDRFPKRLCVFGLTTLPPLYLDVLNAVSEWCEVHLFQLTPSSEWFAEISSPREKARHLRGRDPDYGEEAEQDLHLEEGHPLLARLGRVGREFQWVIEDRLDYVEDGVTRFSESPGSTMLSTVQNDLLALFHRKSADRCAIDPDDTSIEVHGCHSPIREVEVLRDRLHALFEAHPDLRPRDVVVLMPDITEHGPLVEAVFGIDPTDPLHIPYTIADRPLASGNIVARALFAVLDLVRSRMEASAVLDLLSHAPIRERFGIEERELDHIQAMVDVAGIRWGLNEDHRASVGQPEDPIGTWQAGIDRLVLGYAIEGSSPFDDVVPVEHIDAEAAQRLERLVHLHQQVVARVQHLERDRSVAAWQKDLTELLDALFVSGPEHFDALQAVRSAFAKAEEDARIANFQQPVPLDLMRGMVERHLASERRPGAFMRAGVTFCEMLPMRAIPFEVVGLLGMSDGAFPRSDTRLGFDHIAAAPQRGDRSKRLDDRFLLLEAVQSARRAVVATYRSKSIKDNTELPPSVVLAELLDVLDEGFITSDGGPARDHVVVDHPLQPFSPSYLEGDPRRFTYDATAAAGAASLYRAEGRPKPFFAEPLITTPLTEVTLDELANFLQDSVVFFLEHRLGVRPADEASVVRDREPLDVSGIDRFQLGKRVLELRLRDLSEEDAWAVATAEARLPLGMLGRLDRERLGGQVEDLMSAAAEHLDAGRRNDARIELTIDGIQLSGLIDQLHGTARLGVSFRQTDQREARILVKPWVHHLALQLHPDPSLPRITELYARRSGEQAGHFRQLPSMSREQAHAHLSELLRWYTIGWSEPIWFLPDAAWALLSKYSPTRSSFDAFRAARDKARQLWRTDTRSKFAWETLAGGEGAFSPNEKPARSLEASRGMLEPLRDVLGVRR